MILALIMAFAQEPSEPTLVYYNARLALREGRPLEATRLWLLRNAIAEHTGKISMHDQDFRSVTWAALGELGVCQDGYPDDEAGAGLWPLALHNGVVRNRGQARAKRPRPFDAFEVGRQARFVSLGDVLGAEELATVSLLRGRCARPRSLLFTEAGILRADLKDREVLVRLLELLIRRAQRTLDPERVRGTEVLDARLLDIHLAQAGFAAQAARRQADARARRGRELGLSRASTDALRAGAPVSTLLQDGEPARVLRECVGWGPEAWLALSAERRVFLFDQARLAGGDPEALDAVALGVLDGLLDRGEGAELERWVARVGSGPAHPAVWGGARGQRLLALGEDSGFGERAVIALHRGIHQLERGDLPAALRSLALALHAAPSSREGEQVAGLSLRWLSYLAAGFELSDELLLTLRELVPRREYGILLEDLMWSAALRSDGAAFGRGLHHPAGRGALARRLALLHPLADGEPDRFLAGVRTGLQRSPSETLRFLDLLVQRLEREDADVRAAHLPLLGRLQALLHPLTTGERPGALGRGAEALLDRTDAIAAGLGALGPEAASRSLDPRTEVYAGAVRLAPSDPLPWPFRPVEVQPPSVFEPVALRPVEWADGAGGWVFGWSLGG